MSQPRPVPRKRNVAPQSSSPSVTRKGSGKGLDVKGIRSKLDEMSMQQLRDVLEDAGALHGVISTLNVPQVCREHTALFYAFSARDPLCNEYVNYCTPSIPQYC